MANLYLISTSSLENASITAKEMGLSNDEWVWITTMNYDERMRSTLGRKVPDSKYLVGPFNGSETFYLLNNTESESVL